MEKKKIESKDYPFKVSCTLCVEIIEMTGYPDDRCQRCLSKRNDRAYVDYWLFNYASPLKDKCTQKEIVRKYLDSMPVSRRIRELADREVPQIKKSLEKEIIFGLQNIAYINRLSTIVKSLVRSLKEDAKQHIEEEVDNIRAMHMMKLIGEAEGKDSNFFYVPDRNKPLHRWYGLPLNF